MPHLNPDHDAAIIGAGFSGTATAINLARKNGRGFRVALVEKTGTFGPGLAYGADHSSHLLNVVARKMGAFADDERHFSAWAGAQDTFELRARYGTYLADTLRHAAHELGTIAQIHEEAIDLTDTADAYSILLRSGATISARQVVLAIGNLPPRPLPASGPLHASAHRIINNPWDKRHIEAIPANSALLLVGSGLTALDCLTTLQRRGHTGPIHVVSRHGLFPKAHCHIDTTPAVPVELLAATTAGALLREFRRFVRSCVNTGIGWDAAVHAVRPHNQQLWRQLGEREQLKFLLHLKAYWEVHRHRAPAVVAATKDSLLEAGQLIIHAARISSIDVFDEGCDVALAPRGQGNTRTVRVGFVFNCTGPESDYARAKIPLIKNLFRRGLVRQGPGSMGLDATEVGRLIDRNGSFGGPLYTLGPPLKGVLYETTAVGEIRAQAAALAEAMSGHHVSETTKVDVLHRPNSSGAYSRWTSAGGQTYVPGVTERTR